MTRYLKPLLVFAASMCLLGVLFVSLAGQTSSTPRLGDTVVLPASTQQPSGTPSGEPQTVPRSPDLVVPEPDEVDDRNEPDDDRDEPDDDSGADDSRDDADDAGEDG